jgi:anti-anti-sigma factor
VFRDVLDNPHDELVPDVIGVRLDGSLFFATADALEDRVRELTQAQPGARGVFLDCEGINFLDSQGSATLAGLLVLCDQAGLGLRLGRVKPGVTAVPERDGMLDRLGRDHIHGNVRRAVEAQVRRGPTSL